MSKTIEEYDEVIKYFAQIEDYMSWKNGELTNGQFALRCTVAIRKDALGIWTRDEKRKGCCE